MEFLGVIAVFIVTFLVVLAAGSAKSDYDASHPSEEKQFMDSVYGDKSLSSEERATKVAEHLNDKLKKELK